MQKRRTAPTSEPGCLISVRVVPRSARVAILRESPGQPYKVKLTSPPVDGAANKQLVAVLSDALSIPPSRIEIVSGQTARLKRVKISGMTAGEVAARLTEP